MRSVKTSPTPAPIFTGPSFAGLYGSGTNYQRIHPQSDIRYPAS